MPLVIDPSQSALHEQAPSIRFEHIFKMLGGIVVDTYDMLSLDLINKVGILRVIDMRAERQIVDRNPSWNGVAP